MMVPNPITEEIREIRHRLAAQFENDVFRIGAETRRRQAMSGRRVIRLPSRTPADRKSSSQETKMGFIAAISSVGPGVISS